MVCRALFRKDLIAADITAIERCLSAILAIDTRSAGYGWGFKCLFYPIGLAAGEDGGGRS
jgi:hypothetical protein